MLIPVRHLALPRPAYLGLIVGVVACGGDPPPGPGEILDGPVAVTNFSFFRGWWDVASSYRLPDGNFEQTTAVSEIRTEFSETVIKETLTGTRGGGEFQAVSMRGFDGNTRRWTVARADGAAGTFDILHGEFVNRTVTLTSNPVTRPDGGLTRVTWSEFNDDATAFTWQAETSTDGGQTWEVFWTMEYVKSAATGTVSPPTAAAAGCVTPGHAAFDFWIGEWQTFNPGGSANAASSIRPLLSGCVLEENWLASSPGTSYNMYDVRTDLWYQVWIDANANMAILSGGLRDSVMELTSGPNSGGGGPALHRWRWTPLDDGSVHQFGQASSNGGTTWTTSADLIYRGR